MSLTTRIYRRIRKLAGLVRNRLFRAPSRETGTQKSERIVLSNAVIIAVSGGLANQMMCYKAGRYLASLKGSILILDATRYEADNMSNRNFQLVNYPIEYDALIYSSEILNYIKESNGVRVVEKATIPAPTSETAGAFLRELEDQKIVYGNFWLALFSATVPISTRARREC